MTIIIKLFNVFTYFLLVIEDYIGVEFVLSVMLVEGGDQHKGFWSIALGGW